MGIPQKLTLALPSAPATPLWCKYTKEMKLLYQRDTHLPTFGAIPPTVAKTWNRPTHSSIEEQKTNSAFTLGC